MFQTNDVEKIKTHFIFNNFLFRKPCRLTDNVEINVTAGQATDDNKAHVHCMLETFRYQHILTICNIFCLSTATLLPRTRLNITLHVHPLSCYNICKLRLRPTMSLDACDPHKKYN
jgi:hypothetical protein